MNDIHKPLRPRSVRDKSEDDGAAALAEMIARRQPSMAFQQRRPWVRWLGVALIIAGLAGTWWFSRERTDEVTTGAVAAIDRTDVEAPIGPTVDLRSKREPATSPNVVMLDETDDDIETLPEVTYPDGALPRRTSTEKPDDRHPAHLPRPELLQDTRDGPLPRIAASGLTPFEAYRVKGPVAASRIAIVVGGLGLSQTGTQKAIKDLPATVTLAFSPDGNSLQRWTEAARKGGHEIALQVPLAPIGFPEIADSPRTVTAGTVPIVNESLGRITKYATVINHGGGAFAPKADAMAALLKRLSARGLGYVDDGSVSASRAEAAAKGLRLPFAKARVVLDAENRPAAIDAALDRLVAEAKRNGTAIGTAAALPTVIDRIALFAKTAKKRGVTIVPVSNLMRPVR